MGLGSLWTRCTWWRTPRGGRRFSVCVRSCPFFCPCLCLPPREGASLGRKADSSQPGAGAHTHTHTRAHTHTHTHTLSLSQGRGAGDAALEAHGGPQPCPGAAPAPLLQGRVLTWNAGQAVGHKPKPRILSVPHTRPPKRCTLNPHRPPPSDRVHVGHHGGPRAHGRLAGGAPVPHKLQARGFRVQRSGLRVWGLGFRGLVCRGDGRVAALDGMLEGAKGPRMPCHALRDHACAATR